MGLRRGRGIFRGKGGLCENFFYVKETCKSWDNLEFVWLKD